MLRPILHLPRHPLRLARFGIPAAAPATAARPRLAKTPQARALFGGVAAHAFSPLTRPMSVVGRDGADRRLPRVGWPVAAGGSQRDRRRARRGAARARRHGSRPGCGSRSLAELGAADVVVFDLAPGAVAEIAGERLPARVARAYRRYRHGPGAFKLDLAVEGGVPWTHRGLPPRRHRPRRRLLRGDRRRRARRSTAAAMPERPFVLVGQQYLADPEPLGRRRPPGLGLRARAQRLRRRRDRGRARPDRALRAGPARADRRHARSAPPPSSRPTTPTTSAATSSPAPTRRCRSLFRPRLALDPYSDRRSPASTSAPRRPPRAPAPTA